MTARAGRRRPSRKEQTALAPILPLAPTANKPVVYDLTVDLSDWSCDADTCGINGPCDACMRRERVAKLLAERDLHRRPCALDCTTDRPCERCREVNEYMTWLYQERDQVAVLLRMLRQLARVFPNELRELLVDPVCDIMEDAQ